VHVCVSAVLLFESFYTHHLKVAGLPQGWNILFYFFSFFKVCTVSVAVMRARECVFVEHFFVLRDRTNRHGVVVYEALPH